MSDVLPQGWSHAKIVDLIAFDGIFSDGDWVESKDQDPNGSIRLLQLADIGDGKFLDKSSRFVNKTKFFDLRCTELHAGDVLIARMPRPLGRACLLPQMKQRCITVVDVAIIRPGQGSVITRWLMHTINTQTVRREIESLSSGTTRKRIARKKLSQIEIAVPPLNEQKRIAEKLDQLLTAVDAAKNCLDKVPTILKRFRQSVLAAAVSGELTKDWRKENKVSFTWDPTNIKSVAQEIRYGTSKKCIYDDTLTPVLRIPNVKGRYIDLTDLKYADFTQKEIDKLSLKKGDILIVRSNGSVDLVGKAVEVTKKEMGYIFAGYLIRIRLNKKRILPGFLQIILSSPMVRRIITVNARSTSGVHNINSKELAAIKFERPSLPEQEEIFRKVTKLLEFTDKLELRLQHSSKVMDYLIASILTKAFRGELVPQDPNDEPAEVLLQRIANEKKEQQAGKPAKRRKKSMVSKTKKESFNSIVEVLKSSNKPLSAQQLLSLYVPGSPGSDAVEDFFVALRACLAKNEILRQRLGDEDWFSLTTGVSTP